MGLGGRKVKQRIPDDPRNLSWADDAARFGSNYLSKFGWDASQGLGVGGEGRTSYIKVSHKLDMLGIGAAHQKDPDGIAWKQNKDFENLLKRLNETTTENVDVKEGEQDVAEAEKPIKKRKQKVSPDEDKKKKRRKTEDTSQPADEVVTEPLSVEPAPTKAVPRYRAHRARAIVAKSISSKSAASISEILGIAPSSGLSITTETTGKLTPLTDDASIEKLTTSTKSVADYFKEKLLVRATKSGSATPASEPDAYDLPRGGLGSRRARFEIIQEDDPETEARRVGISKFSSLMSSSFLSATSSVSTPPSTEMDANEDVATAQSEEEQTNERKKGRKKKKGDRETKERKTKEKATRTEVQERDTPQAASLDDMDRKARKAQRKAEKKERKAAGNNLL